MVQKTRLNNAPGGFGVPKEGIGGRGAALDVTLSMRHPRRTRGTSHSPFSSAMQVSCIAKILVYIYMRAFSFARAKKKVLMFLR